jgi:hypothetical protein
MIIAGGLVAAKHNDEKNSTLSLKELSYISNVNQQITNAKVVLGMGCGRLPSGIMGRAGVGWTWARMEHG